MKKLLLFITILAVVFAAFTLTACGGNNDDGNPEEEKGSLVDVNIPYISEFTCDYYTIGGEKIADKTTVFNPDDEIRIKIGFTISTAAFEAGKSKFTLKFMPDEGFTGRITSANSSSTSDADFTATFATDDKNPKKCTIETKIGINYSSGSLRIGYSYDDEETSEACVFPLNNDKTLSFEYDAALGGYIITDSYAAFDEIVIPDEIMGKPIKKIADSVFYNCKTLKKIVLSENIEIIGKTAFEGCDNLARNEYENAYYLASVGNEYFCLLSVKDKTATEFRFAESCGIIYDGAFSGCKMKNVALPDSVTGIGNDAFAECGNLKNIVLSDSLISVGSGAFPGGLRITSTKAAVIWGRRTTRICVLLIRARASELSL